jgi:hypothetical protein
VERVLEVQHLMSSFAPSGGHVLSHLPVEGRLQRVLDGERATFDEEVLVELGGRGGAGERVDEVCEIRRVLVGVCDLHQGRLEDAIARVLIHHARVVEAERVRREERVEIDELAIVEGIAHDRALATLKVDDERIAVDQHVTTQGGVDLSGRDSRSSLSHLAHRV